MRKIKLILIQLILILGLSKVCLAAPYITLNLNYDGKNHHYNAEEVYLYINSNKIENLTMPPIILNNSTLVPAREVFENLGATVTWDNKTRKIEIKNSNTNVTLQIDSTQATVNNDKKTMSIPPKLINNKTMIPVRFVSEAIGSEVLWDNKTRAINILTKTQAPEPEKNNQSTINIINFELPDSDEKSFKITADNEINNFKVLKTSDKSFSVEIYDAKNKLSNTKFNSVIDQVKEVSFAEYSDKVEFNFKINDDVKYDALLSNDKKSILIVFDKNPIKSIEFFNDSNTEILKVTGEYEPFFEINENKANNTIIIELKNAIIENLSENIKYNNFIKNIKYYQSSENSVTIEVSFVENAKNIDFNTNVKDNVLFINFTNSNELDYNPSKNRITIPKKNHPINLNSIIHTDNYLKKEYLLTFDTDITSLIDTNSYEINTSLIKNIKILPNNSKTQIVINSKKIIAVNIFEDLENIYIDILEPKEKYKNIVVIDAGHGGTDGGSSANKLLEKEINLSISNYLLEFFEKDQNIKAYSARTTDFYPSFDDRTSLGNEVGDVFISIHSNSAGTNTKAKGTEVYYLNENTNSSGLKSSDLASTIQANLLDALGTYNRKIKTSNFKVLRDSKIPAVLCEIGFITNEEDAKKLADEKYRKKAAEAIYKACKTLFEKHPSR